MHIDQLQKKFWAAARALPPSDRVPYAFEKRIMAVLATQPAIDPWAIWSRLLWRAAAPCVGIMLVVSAWSAMASASNNSAANLAADLDRTVWGPLVSLNDAW